MTTTPTPTTPTAATGPPGLRRWSAGRTVLVVAGSFLALLGLGALTGGAAAAWAGQQRDNGGYLTSGPGRFTTDTYAISATTVHVDVLGPDVYGQGQLGKVRIQAQPAQPGGSLFVGVGPAEDVAAYLDPVHHVQVSDLEAAPFDVTYREHAGGQPATGPAAQTFWTAAHSGTGPQTITWPIAAGDWAVVIMNTDASAGVQADVTAGAALPVLRTVAIIAFIVGGLLLVAGIAMIVAPIATRGRRQPATAPADLDYQARRRP
jgi:hypothetical protein